MSASLWLFDFDNTLARLEPVVDWAASRRELEPMLRSAGAPEPLFQKFPKGNLVLYEAYRAHLAGLIRPDGGEHAAMLSEASRVIEKFELRGVDKAVPLDGAIELLRALSGAANLIGVVTSNSSRTVSRWFELHGIAAMLTTIVGRDSLFPLKPAPDSLLEAVKRADASLESTVYVGDTVSDLAAAQSAGMRFYGIAPTQPIHDALRAAGAREIFLSPADLGAQLKLLTP